MPLSDDQWEEWYERHNSNSRWLLAHMVLSTVLMTISIIIFFTSDNLLGQVIFLFLGSLSFGLSHWHKHVDKQLHEEVKDADDL